jgi:hypothetical protein
MVAPAPVFKFDRAAPNDEFPEGGLRIVGSIANLTNDALTGDTSTAAGCFPGHTSLCLFSPTAYSSAAATLANNMFGASNPISEIAQWFRRFRYRKVGFRYEGESQTGVAGAVQISVDREAASALSSAAAAVGASTLSSPGAVRMPIWTAQCEIPLIDQMKSDSADELFHCTAANSEVTFSLASADQNQYFQGGAFAVVDAAVAASATFARWRWDFVLDLYGFMAIVADGAVTQETRNRREEKCREERAKQEVERKERTRRLEERKEDDDYLVLRTREPQHGFARDPGHQGLEPPPLRREETKAQLSARSASLKG